ncbi:MAG: hypothetical protein IKV25_04120 [Clostridia bacterium]|nr:hypothetical protein [Clostridia bacterium]
MGLLFIFIGIICIIAFLFVFQSPFYIVLGCGCIIYGVYYDSKNNKTKDKAEFERGPQTISSQQLVEIRKRFDNISIVQDVIRTVPLESYSGFYGSNGGVFVYPDKITCIGKVFFYREYGLSNISIEDTRQLAFWIGENIPHKLPYYVYPIETFDKEKNVLGYKVCVELENISKIIDKDLNLW